MAAGAGIGQCPACVRELAFEPPALVDDTAIAWAIYTVCLRWRAEAPRLAMLWVIAAMGVCAMIPFYAWELAAGRTLNPTAEVLGALLYIGALSTVVSYVFWNRAVQEVGPNRAGPFMPDAGLHAAACVVFIGERLHLYHLIGCALILGGIYLTSRGRPASAPVEEASISS